MWLLAKVLRVALFSQLGGEKNLNMSVSQRCDDGRFYTEAFSIRRICLTYLIGIIHVRFYTENFSIGT